MSVDISVNIKLSEESSKSDIQLLERLTAALKYSTSDLVFDPAKEAKDEVKEAPQKRTRKPRVKAEEPKAEEPKAEKPKAEKPKAEKPKAEKPKRPSDESIRDMAKAIITGGRMNDIRQLLAKFDAKNIIELPDEGIQELAEMAGK